MQKPKEHKDSKNYKEYIELRRQLYDKMQEWERMKEVKDQTKLGGKWENISLECPFCDKDTHVYMFEDNRTCYCLPCAEEWDIREMFDGTEFEISDPDDLSDTLDDAAVSQELQELVSDDPKDVNDAIRKMEAARLQSDNQTKNHKPQGKGFQMYDNFKRKDTTTTFNPWNDNYKTGYVDCTHRPTHIIDGTTWGIWVGKKWDVRDCVNDYDVVMNLTYDQIKKPHIIPIPELQKYQSGENNGFQELQVDWPDFGVVNLPRQFWIDFLEYIQKNNLKVLVFCFGGHGRTGTAAAILMGMSLNMSAEDSIQWIRKNYCWNAVETAAQEAYIKRMLEKPTSLEEALKSMPNDAEKTKTAEAGE